MRLKYLLVLLAIVSCSKSSDPTTTVTDTNFTTDDWSTATHSNTVDPDYATVFAQDKVNVVEITLTADQWTSLQTNMKTLYGSDFGAGGGQGPGGGPGGGNQVTAEPDYVAVSLKFNNKQWYKVGFRLKGNSSLSASWRSGIYKLPFRLHFDKFEDTYPQIKDQRFYGFKELSMSPAAKDNSLIREKTASDIFRKAGIPCAQTSFWRVYINFGNGSKYCGVYTMVEIADDTMINTQFVKDAGNIYKPESALTTFNQADFEKKNNEKAADYSDVQQFVTALNSPLRTSDPVTWRANLEAVFDVDHFLHWLAVNTTMTNWDTYGRMAHNYYLYHNAAGKLVWIPWDNNESLNLTQTVLSMSMSEVSSSWPLIRYLMNDAVYVAQYKQHLSDFQTTFTSDYVGGLVDTYHALIAPYVIGPESVEEGKYTQLNSTAAFTSEPQTIKQVVTTQQAKVTTYLQP